MMRGRIYKITCNATGKCYVGSTTRTLKQRLAVHLCTNNCSSREVLANNDFKIELIEEIECETRDELRIRERYWYDQIECVNCYLPIITVEEKRDQHRKCNQKYHDTHRDTVNAKRQERIICECGTELARTNLSSHRKTKAHLEKMSAKNIENAPPQISHQSSEAVIA